ncbi:hypothetical protein [Streptomyces sp. NPDC050287]|uniref:hypothetical protein n=1 Tax=Streptomyces sp. NPDC050287 TaxID=3365608 RepID=UPI00378D73CF
MSDVYFVSSPDLAKFRAGFQQGRDDLGGPAFGICGVGRPEFGGEDPAAYFVSSATSTSPP